MGQIDPSKKIPSRKRPNSSQPRPKVKQLHTISAGNKNNPYAVPGKKTPIEMPDVKDIVNSEQTKAAAKSVDNAIGKTYRAVKSQVNKSQEKKAPKKEKKKKYAQGWTQSICPIKDIKYGIVHTTSGMYVKILEILPVDFFNLSINEKNNIIANYRKIFENTSREFHIKIINDTNNPRRIIDYIKQRCEEEKYQKGISQKVIDCAQDKINHIIDLSDTMSITSRYFLIYKYDGKSDDINEIFPEMESLKIHYANVFRDMGNSVIERQTFFIISLTELLTEKKHFKTE